MCVNFYFPEMLIYAAAVMTLLRCCGIRQVKPFAIICNSVSQQDMLVKRCKLFSDNRKHGLKTVLGSLRKYMDATKDDLLFIQYASDKKMDDLAQICEAVSEGYWEDEVINCMVCVLFDGYMPEELSNYFSIVVPANEVDIFLKSEIFGLHISEMIVGKREYLNALASLLQQQYHRRFFRNSPKGDEELLYVAALTKAFLDDKSKFTSELCELVEEKIELSADARDRSDIPDLFVDTLYKRVELLYPMVSYLEVKYSGNIENQNVLYDDQFYYFPEKIMEALLRNMMNFAGTTEIKQALARAGYLDLQGNDRVYYTQKIRVGDKRCYYYRLKREAVDRPGEVTLVMACELEGEQ